MNTITLKSKIQEIKGFGPKKAEAFSRLGIFCIGDFLRFYPRDYEDLRNKKMVKDLVNDEKAVVQGVLVQNSLGRGWGRKRTLHLAAVDKSGRLDILFFMAGFMSKNFKIGTEYRFYGKVKLENGRATMFHPAYTEVSEDMESGIQPIYPMCKGITQKDIKKGINAALEAFDGVESLPISVIDKANLCPLKYALNNVHFPAGENEFKAARYRLVFEELFDLRVALKLSANRFGAGREGISFKNGSSKAFIQSLSYDLTAAQKKALEEIERDMDSNRAMNRLLQGDVGSGKTVVAEAAMIKAVNAGYQAAFMAPTEILACQHFESLSKDFKAFGLQIVLLTSSLKAAEKRAALKAIEKGDANIIVGTHALLSEGVIYKNLGLCITDEQHRFGVNQRKVLSEKGENPDILVMTATPIPRTLAVVLYSDLDISIIDELPAGRKEIITRKCNADTRKEAYKLLAEEVKKGRQAYVVAPFIEDSEAISGYSAEGLFEEFKETYPNIPCALLHGDMKAAEKDEVMTAFAAGKIAVLIATVVIEVGINVPNATVMLIENAERFGLAQLHQLRGRVGRGQHQSYCYLILGEESEIARERARIMCDTNNGFVIAEKDLAIRGPGELFGYRQHGLPQLQLADPAKHGKVIELASSIADELLLEDPGLQKPENRAFSQRIEDDFIGAKGIVL